MRKSAWFRLTGGAGWHILNIKSMPQTGNELTVSYNLCDLTQERPRRGVSAVIRIAIAEDDPRCFAQLERYIGDYGRETGRAFQVTHYGDGEDLVERYKPGFDLILMDVEMPFMDGMTAAGYIREKDPEVVIVFVTNLAQYAIQGYSVNALDYILKPVSYFSFSQRLGRALQYVKKKEDACITVAVKGGGGEAGGQRHFLH